MVSAVFHSPPLTPIVARADLVMVRSESTPAGAMPAATAVTAKTATLARIKPARQPIDWRAMWLSILPPVFGLGLLVGIWALVSITTASSIPSPIETFRQAMVIFSDPFYSKGPNDQGVGWNVLMSLQRVALGWPRWWAFRRVS